MGAKVAQVKSEAKTYRVENDNAPFYDNKLGGFTLPEDLNNKEYKAFETFFLKIFPKPHDAEQELCETEGQHREFIKQSHASRNPYAKWVFQCWAHIKKGYRVGIPYLRNTSQKSNLKDEKYNLPPLRYRHMFNTVTGTLSYSSTMRLVAAIQATILHGNVSNDVCNRFFDAMIYDYEPTPEYEKKINKFLHDFEVRNVKVTNPDIMMNEDQSPVCQPIMHYTNQKNVMRVLKTWGKAGSMKCAFPTLWYKFRGNLYGDGTKTDPEIMIWDFPRLHDDFQLHQIYFPIGSTMTQPKPSQLLLDHATEFTELFGLGLQENAATTVADFPKKRILQMQAWLQKDKHWEIMRAYLLNNCPQVLWYYYLELSQTGVSHHVDYCTATSFMLYRTAAKWMHHSPTIIRWKNNEQSPAEIPIQGFEWLQPNTTQIRPDADGNPSIQFTRDGANRVTIYNFKTKVTTYVDILSKTTTHTTQNGEVVKHTFNEDRTTTITKEKDGQKEVTQMAHDGKILSVTVIDETWIIPSDYGLSIVNPNLFESPQMTITRQGWMDSHLTAFGDGFDWVHDASILPTFPDAMQPTSGRLTDLPAYEYIKHVFNFMKEHPLPKPRTPGIFEDPSYRNKLNEMLGTHLAKTTWQRACEVQWAFYLLWIESNINAAANEKYIKPGQLITHNDRGLPVFNQIPDTGILAPYEGHEGVAKVGHILFFGLTVVFGDTWWTELIGLLKESFDFCVKELRKLWENVILPNLPAISGTVLLIGGLALAGYGLSSYIGERARLAAR